jgi:hypothetical protein
MDESCQKLEDAAYGRLLPSVLNRHLQPLDALATIPVVCLFLQIFLAFLYHLSRLVSTLMSRFVGMYHAVHATLFFLLTYWRIGFPVPSYRGRRVREREFGVSRSFRMKEVKTIQKAFSKPRGRIRRGHLTVNDVLVAIMADVLDLEVRSVASEAKHSPIRRLADRFLPSTVAFFMSVSFSLNLLSLPSWRLTIVAGDGFIVLSPSAVRGSGI